MHKKAHKTSAARRGPQKGSALLVSLMVMVGLSLLGLTFVAISETESAISINERNKTQTTALAEAGAKTVVQWFQDPTTMNTIGLLPGNIPAIKTNRVIPGYSGRYRPVGSDLLCEKPFGPKPDDQFYGTEQFADIIIEPATDTDDFLDDFNDQLFRNNEGGRITSIRIYAPPIIGGVLINNFWVAGQRYGIATIAVTAEKTNARGAVIARSVCRLVIAPFPLPGPTGAVQPVGGFASNGAYEVHWGGIESEATGETYVKREATSLPWFDAYDRAYIEYGYDSSKEWKADTEYFPGTNNRGETVRPTQAKIAAIPELANHEYTAVAVQGDRLSAGAEPAWENFMALGVEFWDDNVRWKERPPTAYPIQTSAGAAPYTGYRNHAWLYEMLRRTVDDPWFVVRVRGYLEGGVSGLHNTGTPPQVFQYPSQIDADMTQAGNFTLGAANDKQSHYFQYQTYSSKPLYKLVDIPAFDYEFWKAAAQAARGEPGVYYLRYIATGPNAGKFTDGIETQTFDFWKEKDGFLFFDTVNNSNPQKLDAIAKAAALVDGNTDPCPSSGGFLGMMYGNFDEIKSGGCEGLEGWYRMPGEPYRDIGFRRVNTVSSGMNIRGRFTTDASGNFTIDKAYNGEWNYQDLPWSNGSASASGNGFFDVCVQTRTFTRESGTPAGGVTEFVPMPYFPGCVPGNNISLPACTCSEPHEPHINIDYTGDASPTATVQALWEDPNLDASTYPKETNTKLPDGTPVPCTRAEVASKAGQARCATNAHDDMGALANIIKHAGHNAPTVVGLLYNEGAYNSTGNAAYYGSIVVGGQADPNGTQEVWFDECLTKGCWPPPGIPFPRVMITSTQIQ